MNNFIIFTLFTVFIITLTLSDEDNNQFEHGELNSQGSQNRAIRDVGPKHKNAKNLNMKIRNKNNSRKGNNDNKRKQISKVLKSKNTNKIQYKKRVNRSKMRKQKINKSNLKNGKIEDNVIDKNSKKRTYNKPQLRATSDNSSINASCLTSAMNHLKLVKDKVTNFLKQEARMNNFNKTAGKKQGKKGLFAPISHKIIDVGGGNATNLSCGGTYGNPGAEKLTLILATLKACEGKIQAACNPSAYPLPENMTKITECSSIMKTYKKDVTACTKKKGVAACTCWSNANLTAMSDIIKGCDVSKENVKVTSQHKLCSGNFSACKSTEDQAGEYVYTCRQTVSQLTKKAALVKASKDALTSAKAKVSELAGNSTSNSSRRARVQRALTDCASVVKSSSLLLAIAAQVMTSDQITTLSKAITSVGTISCTEEQKSALSSQEANYTMSIALAESVLTTYKSSVLDSSGSEPTDSELDAITNSTSGTSGNNGTDSTNGTSSETSGNNGTNSTSGASGNNGTNSTSGTSENNGTNSTSGTSGNNGTNSTSETSGNNGTNSTSGTSGNNGTNSTGGTSENNGTNSTSGTSGNNGTNSTSGTSGNNGTNSTSGTSGNNGTNSTSGTSGNNGTNTTSGTSGNNGTNSTSGTSGNNGTNSTSGTSGNNGTNSTSGTSGNNGTNSTSGTSGNNGTNSTSGTSGNNGTNSTSGSSGNNGTNSTSGTSGNNGTNSNSGSSGDNGRDLQLDYQELLEQNSLEDIIKTDENKGTYMKSNENNANGETDSNDESVRDNRNPFGEKLNKLHLNKNHVK